MNKKTAVIIGATGNLGKVVSKTLKEKNFFLDPKWLISEHPDATNPQSYKDLPETIHCAVYVAGIQLVKSASKLTLEEWNRVLAVNLTGAFLFAQAAYPSMVKANGAVFIVISSILATHPYPDRVAYSASKAGLEGLTRALAVEWGSDKISVNCIRLGHLSGIMKSSKINSQLLLDAVKSKTPSGELIDPQTVADYIAWLAEGGARSVSGTVLDFDPAYIINRNPLA